MLVLLAGLGFFYGSITCVLSWSTLVALAGSHGAFISAVRQDGSRMVEVPKQLGSTDDVQRLAERKAEALWSRRGVFIPLAVANAVLSSLMLLGIAGAVSRRLAWGRSAWRFAALVSLVAVAMEGVANYVHARDLIQAVADLHDPLSEQIRQLLPANDVMLGLRLLLEVGFLLVSAAYVSTQAVVRYCDRG